jgi:cytochrome b6-f complex iron-sulfur subunit
MSDREKSPTASEPLKSEPAADITRRDFFNEVASAALGVAGLGATIVTIRYLSPNVLFEPSTTFRVGNPDLFPVNSVTYVQDQQVYIVRTVEGFHAVSAVCTHLGCITQWKPEANQIACPCHGSKFKPDGTKIEGPAPRPLPHFAISLTEDGQLLVDKLQNIKATQALKV